MSNLKDRIKLVNNEFLEKLKKVSNKKELEDLRIRFFGRSGEIASLMHSIKDLSIEEKRILGQELNNFKKSAESVFNLKKEEIDLVESKKNLVFSQLDVTAYKPFELQGTLHPYTYVIEQIENIFISMGYEIADGPELEDDFYNFQALNIPADHPARDMQDTFWLNLPQKLMRTHTSPVQIRAMQFKKPPMAILATGRCYRNEATDASHDFVFMQTEALLIDKDISLSNLFATIKVFLELIFSKKDLDIRFRPGYFPFVEPGIEVDMQCPFCDNGCSVCKKTRWIEIMGAGLVHPNVLKAVNINSKEYSGFAFGLGLTRLVMLKYGINDIRLLSSGKLEFLEQF